MDLSTRIRERRLALGLTLEALAERTGVSRAMLSDIERGRKNPTVKLLAGIAEGLGCTVSALLGEDGGPPREAISVVRRSERRTLVDPRSGVERQGLAPALLHRGVEVIWYDIPPGQETGAFPPHRPGVEEHITVVAGRLRCTLAGQELTLETGDSVTFRGDIVHNFANAGPEPCRYLLIIL
jgi:transcriptional regulator with XRE-family HTH domain